MRDLLDRVDLPQRAAAGSPQPDRYVYVVSLGDGESYEVQESALDDDTAPSWSSWSSAAT